mmetsp:Transcript_24335/g.49263  ORF Transcript_24335/g.49263 Transcript_24335/m.49263 type:complete len:91 (-) Transcript_24335:1176-1448(-)
MPSTNQRGEGTSSNSLHWLGWNINSKGSFSRILPILLVQHSSALKPRSLKYFRPCIAALECNETNIHGNNSRFVPSGAAPCNSVDSCQDS